MFINEQDFNGDGWHLKIGQYYSSPYEANHMLITKLELFEDNDPENIMVYYKEVNPADYTEILFDEEQKVRAWYVNGGAWDLERDINHKYIIYDCFKKENNSIHADYTNESEALKELSRDDEEADGFYMITETE